MFLFGKSKRQDNGALRSGTIEKTFSLMIAVPKSEDDISDKDSVLARLKDTDEIKILSNDIPIRVEYKGNEYELGICISDGLCVKPNEPSLNTLTDDEREKLMAAKMVLGTKMKFSDNNMDSFHLQIKLMNMLVPNMVALIDDSIYRIFSGRWVAMAAESKIAPSPQNMVTIHAVSDNGGKSVWIHTHGLNRCGTIELEILGATPENFDTLGNVLQEMSQRLIGDNKFIDEKEPILIGTAEGDRNIVVTWQRSEWALHDFPKNIVGNIKDRDEEHSINMGVVYVYESDEDAMNGKITPIIKWDKYLENNAVIYKTTEETERMRALALERVKYLRKMYEQLDGEKTVLIKIELTPDKEHGFNENMHEYIWFEVNEMRENDFTATLTQDAFFVEGMVEGVQKNFTYDEIVDWRMYYDGYLFLPDNIYRIIDRLTD